MTWWLWSRHTLLLSLRLKIL
jgi:SirA-like protein